VSVFVERYFGFHHSFLGYTVLLLVAAIVVFRLVALLALKKLNFQQR